LPLLWPCGSRVAQLADLGDTHVMSKPFEFTVAVILVLVSTVVFATPETLDRRQLLDDQIVGYLTQALDLTPSAIATVSIDKRLEIPDCPPGFSITLPYADHQTILVECDDPKWSAYVRAKVAVVSEFLAYAKDLTAGTLITAADIRVETKITRQVVPREQAGTFVGQLLVRPVRQGQAVIAPHVDIPFTVYALKEAVTRGDPVILAKLSTELKGSASVPINQRVSSHLLQDAVAAKNLAQGQRLVVNDLQLRWSRLVVTKPIPYGQALSSENVEVQSLYGVEKPQALTSIAEITQTQATRTLSAGHIILATDIRPAPLIRKLDAVNMIVESGALTITVGLIAEEDGMLHQLIKLRNPDSGEQLQGIVTGSGQVKLQY
jgi:flagella basal body P-ring formation protein FlgA